MDIEKISTEELIIILEERVHHLKGLSLAHPIDGTTRLDTVKTLLGEIERRFEAHKQSLTKRKV